MTSNRQIAYLLLVGLAGCATAPTSERSAEPPNQAVKGLEPGPDNTAQGPVNRGYQWAVLDAKTPEVGERQTTLTAIDPSNTKLPWRHVDGEDHVLVVTWTSWDGYGKHLGGPLELGRDVWVTAAYDIADFCMAQDQLVGQAQTRRLEQRLGLPPHNGKTMFVEMWVKPADMFRPCPDPEVNDTACELEFPTDPAPSPEHVAWIENLRASSYGAGGYPWTQLGYTFDWGSDFEVGTSEFVVSKGARVFIERVAATADYCDPMGTGN